MHLIFIWLWRAWRNHGYLDRETKREVERYMRGD